MRERLSSRLSAERAKADLERLDRLTQRGPLRVVRAAIDGFRNHNDTLWASALTYTFSLSLVPILAVALSAVKGLVGVDVIKPVIEQYLAINSPELTDRLLQYVGHINAATLGTVGGATLLVTVLLTLSTIERSFNTIFNVPQERTWIRKFTDYLSIIFTVPLLLAAAASLKGGIAMNCGRGFRSSTFFSPIHGSGGRPPRWAGWWPPSCSKSASGRISDSRSAPAVTR
jgi:uncharacterized BrkB/YihY/UPF0761 family membrane protein